MSVQGVVDLVTCALLEHQIILKSSDYTRLILVAECLTSLLFPFQWTLLYVPIVFTAALVCLDVPVPAIMSLRINKSMGNGDDQSEDDDDGYSDTSDEATFEVQRCVVHIDRGEIQLPDDMPRFPDRSSFIEELYADIDIVYRVTIIPTRTRATGIASTTTANPYVALAGLLGSTKVLSIPSKNTLEIEFKVRFRLILTN